MQRPEKEAAIEEVAEILENAKSIFITDFKGLSVEKISALRQKCREVSVSYKVVKNTLARIAAKKAGYNEMVDYFQGPSAIAYSYKDPSAPARVVMEFAKKEEKPKIKVSLFEGTFYGPEDALTIARLPSKQQLLAQVVGGFSAPIQGLVGGLNQIVQKLVMTVDAVRQKKEQS